MKTSTLLRVGRRDEVWSIVSLRLRKSGIAPGYQEGVGMGSTWEIHYKIMGYVDKFVTEREVVEFIMDPKDLEAGDVRKVYNPELLPWLTEEESSMLRERLVKHMDLPQVLPLWGSPPLGSDRVWDSEEVEALFSTSDEVELDKALDMLRRRRTYRKFGI